MNAEQQRAPAAQRRPLKDIVLYWLAVLVGLGGLAVLFRFKVSNPLLVGATAVIGLIAYPLLQPAWVMVK
jgi:hypothetical protein